MFFIYLFRLYLVSVEYLRVGFRRRRTCGFAEDAGPEIQTFEDMVRESGTGSCPAHGSGEGYYLRFCNDYLVIGDSIGYGQ